jgi:hypothetical protein
MFNNQILRGAGQLQTLLYNAAQGCQYINYTPTFIIQDSKRLWPKRVNRREVGCIIYKGRDEKGNKHYEMISPAKKFNPNVINESPMDQSPVPNIGINRQTPRLDVNDPKGIEKYITDVIANYFNAAFTKTPYFPPQWGKQETDMLANAVKTDPSIALRTSQRAFSQASSVKIENTVNQELNDNVKKAMKQGIPPFNTQKQDKIIGPVSGVPSNGIDFANSFYNNSLNVKNQADAEKPAPQNGYIPYQTHNENPKNRHKYLVEQYSNMMNAALTGTPYSGSITPAELKALSASVKRKMAKDPGYMSQVVNQARQNVLGSNYMPYDKDDFITKAQDHSSREFELLNQSITGHVKDICKNKKPSFNGEFQELSKQMIEKINSENTEKKEARPSIAREVTEFVKNKIVEKKPALILVDTLLGTVVDKAKKIVRTGKTIAAAFIMATNLLAPNLQLPTINTLSKIPPVNTISISVNHDASRSAANEHIKTAENHQQPVKSAARR